MSQLWMDGFDHYGGDKNLMLEGPWADFQLEPEIDLSAPVEGARTGTFALKLSQINSFNSFETSARRVLGGDFVEIFAGLGMHLNQIPINSDSTYPLQFQDNGGGDIATLTVRGDGGMIIRDGDRFGAILGQTTGPVVQAGTWHHLEMRLKRDAAAGIFELRVDGIEVLNVTGLSLGANNIAQILHGVSSPIAVVDDPVIMHVDDVIMRDTAGTVNNGFEGDLRVATLHPIANGVNQGWAGRGIQKLGAGVADFLDSVNRDKAISYADNVSFRIDAGDFAIECFVRFTTTVPSDDFWVIMSKWLETDDDRSWRLMLEGENLSGNLIFQTSTDGQTGTVVNVHDWPFVPVTDRWYHIAVTREGTDSRLFIDGVQAGVDEVDARSYDNNKSALFVNGGQGAGPVAIVNESVDGWMDGVRFTVGAARYTANFFPPTTELPADVGGDPLFNSVELLLNFDDVDNTDQSTNAFVGVLLNDAAVIFPDDDEAYQTIASLEPDDNNFVEAALIQAIGTLTLTGQPLDTETVVLGATTYTFLTVFVDAANNVLIGADAQESLDNLQAAVNLEVGAGTVYGTATVLNTDAFMSDLPGSLKLATARVAGAAGNALATTETLTNGAWSAATLLGGLDIPPNSEFTLSALPPDATGVRAVATVSRSVKTDAGAAELTMSFVTSDGSAGAGAAHPLTVNERYYEDTVEVDPSTSGDLTPSSIISSRIRLDRTT